MMYQDCAIALKTVVLTQAVNSLVRKTYKRMSTSVVLASTSFRAIGNLL